MRKKWLALALSLTMVAGCLTGCGGSDSTTSNTNSGSSSNDSAKVPGPTNWGSDHTPKCIQRIKKY